MTKDRAEIMRNNNNKKSYLSHHRRHGKSDSAKTLLSQTGNIVMCPAYNKPYPNTVISKWCAGFNLPKHTRIKTPFTTCPGIFHLHV